MSRHLPTQKAPSHHRRGGGATGGGERGGGSGSGCGGGGSGGGCGGGCGGGGSDGGFGGGRGGGGREGRRTPPPWAGEHRRPFASSIPPSLPQINPQMRLKGHLIPGSCFPPPSRTVDRRGSGGGGVRQRQRLPSPHSSEPESEGVRVPRHAEARVSARQSESRALTALQSWNRGHVGGRGGDERRSAWQVHRCDGQRGVKKEAADGDGRLGGVAE